MRAIVAKKLRRATYGPDGAHRQRTYTIFEKFKKFLKGENLVTIKKETVISDDARREYQQRKQWHKRWWYHL